MWYFISSTDPTVKYCLLVGKSISVGRRDTDIVIESDPTVSRKHATLQSTHPESNWPNPGLLPVLLLKDESRFGTWVNDVQLPPKQQRQLQDGDQVRFGSPKSTFMCVYEPLVVSTSCLESNQKRAVRGIVARLGGHVTREWQRDCSLLIMSSLSVTVKVVSAMVSLKSIVTPAYLTALEEALTHNREPPQPNQYCPELSDPNLSPDQVSFEPNSARRTIFDGKTFVFLNSAQFNKLNLTVEMAGGLPVLQQSDDNNNNMLLEDGTIVMTSDPDDPTLSGEGKKWVQKVLALLKRHKKRMVPDSEIGYAVVFCSTEKHCNPDVSPGEGLAVGLPSQSLSERPLSPDPEVLVPNTEYSQAKALSGKSVSRGRRHGQASVQASLTGAAELKTEVKPSLSNTATAGDSEDFSADVKRTSAISTPRNTGRKRPREGEGDSEVRGEQKSARMDHEVTQITVKTEKSSQPECYLDGRATQMETIQGKTPTSPRRPHAKPDGSSSDDMGPSANPQRSRNKVLVRDTEIDQSLSGHEKHLSNIDGPQRVSDSDPDTRQQLKSQSSSDETGCVSPHPISKGNKGKAGRSVVKSEPVSLLSDGLDTPILEPDMFGEDAKGTRKKMKTSPKKPERRLDVHEDGERPVVRQHDVPSGFLTTRLPIQNQVSKRVECEPGEITAQIGVEFKSLVVRQARSTRQPQTQTTDRDGCVMWKGRKVKNFKKFRKSEHAGAGRLPQIIGGRDLEPHTNNPRKELDDWYRNALQEESQRNDDDRMVSQLFDWDRKSSKGKARSSR